MLLGPLKRVNAFLKRNPPLKISRMERINIEKLKLGSPTLK
jgi:hypothetical protein